MKTDTILASDWTKVIPCPRLWTLIGQDLLNTRYLGSRQDTGVVSSLINLSLITDTEQKTPGPGQDGVKSVKRSLGHIITVSGPDRAKLNKWQGSGT